MKVYKLQQCTSDHGITFDFDQHALLCLPHLVTCVSHLLELWTASMTKTIAAAAVVFKASHSHVTPTQSLKLDVGSQHFAPQRAVAAKVSANEAFQRQL